MPKGIVKNQHYVPKVYLRKFTHKNEQVFVFDKFTKQSRPSNIKNVASETYFYDLLIDFDVDAETREIVDQNRQLIEHTFSDLESRYGVILDDIVSMIDQRILLNERQKMIMSYFISLQFMRTKEFRKTMMDAYQQSAQFLGETILRFLSKEYEQFRVEAKFNEKYDSIHHASFMFDEEFQRRLTLILNNFIWIIGINETEQPLYTSDNPVIRTAPFTVRGSRVIFPLSPKYTLLLYERTAHKLLAQFEGKFMPLNNNNISELNTLQVLQSYRQVYNSVHDFHIAEQACKQYPEACIAERLRARIQTSSES